MTMDNKVVQTEPVSTTEPVSAKGETLPKSETPPALTKEEVQTMIAEATTKAVGEAKKAGRAELQSQQDRNKAELTRMEKRAKVAEGTLTATQTQLQTLNPEVATEMELAQLKAEKQARATTEQQEVLSQQAETQAKAVQESLNAFLGELKIDPADERLDWASDATDYVSGRARFDASVAKILETEKQATAGGFETRLKALEGKITAGETEANSVNTAASAGATEGSDEQFIKDFASYKIPYSKENVERYNKIQKNSS